MDEEVAEPLREVVLDGYDASEARRNESLMLLGNGMLQLRASPPEAFPGGAHYPGTYRAGCYNRLASHVAGERVENESLVNLPNWLPLWLQVVGEETWLSPEQAEILTWRQRLCMTEGVYHRQVRYRDGAGRITALREMRLVSMAAPQLMALRLEIRPENWSGEIRIRTGLDGRIVNANVERFREYENRHLAPPETDAPAPEILRLSTRTVQSDIRIVLAARTHLCGVDAPDAVQRDIRHAAGLVTEDLVRPVAAGCRLAIEKTAALYTSRDPAVADPGVEALAALHAAPDFAGLRSLQMRNWARLWCRGRITTNDEALLDAAQFHRFHLLQTFSPNTVRLDAGFPPRGWQEAYHGQIFWDELFVFPFLNLRFPELARAILLYRHDRLSTARGAARAHGYRGAMFPWRSATSGREETPRFQLNLLSGEWVRDNTHLQRHIGAAIAHNLWHYFRATGDFDFLSDYGAEMLIEIARFWASIAEFDDARGRYQIRGVIGPDEYHNFYPSRDAPGLDNSAYTNVMAVWTLLRALEVMDHLPLGRRRELRTYLNLQAEEFRLWADIARRMQIIFHDDGVISQFEGFDRLAEIDIQAQRDSHDGERVDWILQARGECPEQYQLTKQADVLMLPYLFPGHELRDLLAHMGYSVAEDELRRTADYYLKRVSHESSLSRIVCAGALSHLDREESWRLFREALYPDRSPPAGSKSTEGLHLGAMAGTMDVLQRHYLGLRLHADALELHPVAPANFHQVCMEIVFQRDEFELEACDGRMWIRASPTNRIAHAIIFRGARHMLEPGGCLPLRLH